MGHLIGLRCHRVVQDRKRSVTRLLESFNLMADLIYSGTNRSYGKTTRFYKYRLTLNQIMSTRYRSCRANIIFVFRLPQETRHLTVLDQAKVDCLSAFALNSLVWMWLRTKGQNPKESEVRLKNCFGSRIHKLVQRVFQE